MTTAPMTHEELLGELHGLVSDLYIALADHSRDDADGNTVIKDDALQPVIDRMEKMDLGLPDEPGFCCAVGAKVRYALTGSSQKTQSANLGS